VSHKNCSAVTRPSETCRDAPVRAHKRQLVSEAGQCQSALRLQTPRLGTEVLPPFLAVHVTCAATGVMTAVSNVCSPNLLVPMPFFFVLMFVYSALGCILWRFRAESWRSLVRGVVLVPALSVPAGRAFESCSVGPPACLGMGTGAVRPSCGVC